MHKQPRPCCGWRGACIVLLEMTLAQLFRSPFVRIPFLGFAIFSSVATSAPASWHLEDATAREGIELARGAIAERRFTYESSEGSIELSVVLDAFSDTSDKVHVVVDGACHVDAVYEQREPKRWHRLDSQGAAGAGWSSDIRARATCSDGKKGSVTVRIENLGAAPTTFMSSVSASIGGATGDAADVPAGAFVRVRRVP